MLHFNRNFAVETREMSFGQIPGVVVGERGRGRWEVFLTCPQEFANAHEKTVREKEAYPYSLGRTRAGAPKIVPGDDGKVNLVLSSEGGYTRRGSGRIYALKGRPVNVAARANGADGEAGRIGTWSAVVIADAKPGDVFRIRYSGSNAIMPEYVFVTEHGVSYVPENELELYFDIGGIEPPFAVKYNEGRLFVDIDEWEEL
jgi:hypothetical protein